MEEQEAQEIPVTTKKKLLLPVVLLLALLLIIAGAVFAGIQIGKKQTPKTPSEILFNQPTIQATPTTDQTEGWRTYSNTTYGFEFKHPSNYVISSESQPETHSYEILLKNDNTEKALEIYVNTKNISNTPLSPLSKPQPFAPKIINGISWNVTFGSAWGGADPESQPDMVVLEASKNNIAFMITFYGIKEIGDLQNQILSTFKFLP